MSQLTNHQRRISVDQGSSISSNGGIGPGAMSAPLSLPTPITYKSIKPMDTTMIHTPNGHVRAASQTSNVQSATIDAPSNSQQESTNSQESTTSLPSSQPLPSLRPSLSNVSASTVPDTDYTPPTSSDGPSSQDASQPFSQLSAVRGRLLDAENRPASLEVQTPGTPRDVEMLDKPLSPAAVRGSFESQGQITGQKRTASGTFKTFSGSLPTSPIDGNARRHVRQWSGDSHGSRIGELGSQLRARLTYAMVKVQNNWTTQSLKQIEALPLTSPISPTSSTSTLHGPRHMTSPQSNRTHLDGPHHSPSSDGLVSPQERYWRDVDSPHSLASPLPLSPSAARNSTTSYANPRRSAPRPSPLPSLPQKSTSGGLSSLSSIPATPPPKRGAPMVRTPSQQKAAMEQDAVETLVFMSSPGNSKISRGFGGALEGSPLRGAMRGPVGGLGMGPGMVGKRVGFADEVESQSSEELDRSRTWMGSRALVGKVGQGQGDAIDRMLDEMVDGEDSSEEEMGLVRPGPGVFRGAGDVMTR